MSRRTAGDSRPGAVPLQRGLAALQGRYDAAILDSWGVLHDGMRSYAGVLDCLANMRAAGWRTIVLSNAPRRGESVAAQVERFGVPANSYDEIVTSGDLARTALRRRSDSWHARLGRSFFHLGPDRDHGLLDGLGYAQVPMLSACDFVLNTGLFDDETETEDDYADLFAGARARRLPMLCANPDVEVNRGGARIPCAGALAQAYARIGGDVAYHGKPGRAAFEACLARLPGVGRHRVLAIGDSLATDIEGAAGAGIDAAFVTSGIHALELGGGGRAQTAAMEAEFRARGVAPVAVLPSLVWD